MGRRRDKPEVQKAKGYPGRRKSKVDKAIEAAQKRAELFASAPFDSNDPVAPPLMLGTPLFAPALAVWRQEAPRLKRSNLLDDEYRLLFASLCVYLSEFWQAAIEVQTKGYGRLVKTVSGDKMERVSPAVGVRDRAHDKVMELSQRFGFTPLDMYRLMKEQYLVRDQLPGGTGTEDGLFARARGEAEKTRGDAHPVQPAGEREEDVIGILSRMDSEPPKQLN